MKNKFTFFLENTDCDNDPKIRTVIVRPEIKNKNELFELFCSQLKFPEYFGENWDAFYDCLADLSWVYEQKIVIQHKDIPLESINEKKIYIQILSDLVDHWNKYKEFHQLEICFPRKNEREIDLICQNR